MNKNYSYPGIELWADETWKDADAKVHPIIKAVTRATFEGVRNSYASGCFDGRTDGEYNAKSRYYLFSDVVDKWEKNGVHCHITSMGFVAWLAFLPEGYREDSEILVLYHNADMKNPMWAMETMEYYSDIIELSKKEGFVLHIMVQDGPFAPGIYMDILLEVSAIFKLDMKKVYLDIECLKERNESLGDIEGLDSGCFPGGEELFHGRAAVNITNQWIAPMAHQYICSNLNKNNPEFDREALIHSPLGREMAKGMRWEQKYRRWDDPELISEFNAMGIIPEGHYTKGERWITMRPSAVETKGLPLFVCTKEVRPSSEFQALTAFQFYSHFIDIAAAGEFMILFFAMETPDDNELLFDILEEMKELYGYDTSRVYITGQSHNGYLSLEMVRRHPKVFAGIATLNDRHGIASPNYTLETIPVTDEMLKSYTDYDIPLINICGAIENVFPHTEKGTQGYLNAIDSFHRRLKGFRCPDKTDAEIEAALTGEDKANRINGVPGDISETVFSMGFEVYISDILNNEGKRHLRFVTLQNLPHMISPQMAELSWSFLRKFRRDSETGSITEINE